MWKTFIKSPFTHHSLFLSTSNFVVQFLGCFSSLLTVTNIFLITIVYAYREKNATGSKTRLPWNSKATVTKQPKRSILSHPFQHERRTDESRLEWPILNVIAAVICLLHTVYQGWNCIHSLELIFFCCPSWIFWLWCLMLTSMYFFLLEIFRNYYKFSAGALFKQVCLDVHM